MPFTPPTLKLDDPQEQMGRALTNAMLAEKFGEANRTRQRNAMLDAGMKASMGADNKPDPTKLYKYMVDNGLGADVPGQMEAFAKIGKTESESAQHNAQATEHRAKAIGEFYKSAMPAYSGVTDINTLAPRIAQVYKSPLAFAVFGGEEPAKQAFLNEVNEADAAFKAGKLDQWLTTKKIGAEKALEKVYTLIQEKDRQVLAANDKYTAAPFSNTAEATYGPKPEGKGVTVNVNGEKAVSEFDKAVGKARGERFTELEEAAQAAPQMMSEIDRALGILNTGNVILGAGSPMMLDVVRAAKAIGMNVNDEKLVNTEELSRFFAQNTLANIARFKQMGVSLTPMSDSDRRLVEQASAQGTNDPGTIRQLLMIQRRMAQDSITKYNEMAKRYSGNPATAPGQTALSTTPIPIPPNPTPPGAPAVPGGQGTKPVPPAAVEYLRKNPGTASSFDAKYGKGAAARVIGGASNGGRPFDQ